MQYRQNYRTRHSWQWGNLVFMNLVKSILPSWPGVFRSPFGRKTLDSVWFCLDFNRPLITLWDQRDSSSFVICYRKWISGRLKSAPNRTRACSITIFCDLDTLSCGWYCIFVSSIICHPVHKRGYPMCHVLTKRVALYDFMTISIAR